MRFARRVEGVLESVVDKVAGRVFPGGVQPADIATRVIRTVDLAVENSRLGPVAPNRVHVGLHPDDLDDTLPVTVLERALATALEEEAAARGWRLGGPAEVLLQRHDAAARGTPEVTVERRPGARAAWAHLRADGRSVPITDNRVVIGRSDQADVQVTDDSVSRRHALLWREGDQVFVADLGSANGTRVDGVRITSGTRLADDATLTLGGVTARMVTV